MRRAVLSCPTHGTRHCDLLAAAWIPGSSPQLRRDMLLAAENRMAQSRAMKCSSIFGEVVSATPLPVNADFLTGFAGFARGDGRQRLALRHNRRGWSFDRGFDRNTSPGLYDQELAVARLRSARKAIDDSGTKVVLTGRCEAFLVDSPEPFRTSLTRLAAYSEAGRDCLYAPGVSDPRRLLRSSKRSHRNRSMFWYLVSMRSSPSQPWPRWAFAAFRLVPASPW